MVKDQLSLAVDQTIEAAGCEYEPATQRMLLRVGTHSIKARCIMGNAENKNEENAIPNP